MISISGEIIHELVVAAKTRCLKKLEVLYLGGCYQRCDSEELVDAAVGGDLPGLILLHGSRMSSQPGQKWSEHSNPSLGTLPSPNYFGQIITHSAIDKRVRNWVFDLHTHQSNRKFVYKIWLSSDEDQNYWAAPKVVKGLRNG